MLSRNELKRDEPSAPKLAYTRRGHAAMPGGGLPCGDEAAGAHNEAKEHDLSLVRADAHEAARFYAATFRIVKITAFTRRPVTTLAARRVTC